MASLLKCKDYQCTNCNATGVRLWRDIVLWERAVVIWDREVIKPELYCVRCAETYQGVRHRDDIVQYIFNLMPAIPRRTGGYVQKVAISFVYG